MSLSFKGAWNLVVKNTGEATNLYTCRSRDLYINKQTKLEYIKGEYKIFKEKLPELIEDTNMFEFVIRVGDRDVDSEHYLKEIFVSSVLK